MFATFATLRARRAEGRSTPNSFAALSVVSVSILWSLSDSVDS